ncbi:MAG: DinB family protein [Fimbriimonadaceae bacterium]|nr:DinB family protein [Fimbriimonadaceae bacterium]
MSAPEFLISGLNAAAKQINAVFSNIAADHWDRRATSEAMTPLESIRHLAHCYTAFMSEARGQSWDWRAPFDLGVTEPEDILAKANELRAQAVDMVKSSTDETIYEKAINYILLHDAYHVGQMALFRMQTDPTWDPHSLY